MAIELVDGDNFADFIDLNTLEELLDEESIE